MKNNKKYNIKNTTKIFAINDFIKTSILINSFILNHKNIYFRFNKAEFPCFTADLRSSFRLIALSTLTIFFI